VRRSVGSYLLPPDPFMHHLDRTSAMHWLELRAPFLDHEIVQFRAAIPRSPTLRRTLTEHRAGASARGALPIGVLAKPLRDAPLVQGR
jgi:asparagine synthetase B (glutamine-hydrolysing)